ncbi:unnamed protein product [Acanthoscelides obtectus]|uniref:Afadin n=1 Tax=Acanthoscelides obtectus TaxID=200917 RepID=A0A9P0KKZ2_ACAOB|nr:unnamed protein product [Acanthoscelides obtectus]CAK1647167.1 Afadin [Acanthoscelides obtectus]
MLQFHVYSSILTWLIIVSGSIMFHVRRRPADMAPRKRKKKPGGSGGSGGGGSLGGIAGGQQSGAGGAGSHHHHHQAGVPLLIELGPDGSAPHPSDTARTVRLTGDVMEVGSANGIGLQLYGPHIQPRHAVITHAPDSGITTVTPCHPDAHTYVNGQRIHQTAPLQHGSLVKFGHSNTYRFVDPQHEERLQHRVAPQAGLDNGQARLYDSRSPRALSPTDPVRENIETTFDLEGNVETVSTTSGAREDNRSLGSSSENRLSGIDRYPRGQDPILPAVLEFPEEPQEQFLARVITHLDVTTPTFRLAPAYTLYLCARYRASTHYRPELTPTERAHKLTLLLQHAAMLIRHTVQDRSTDGMSQAFWLANASELLHFLKSDRHVSAFSLQAQDTLADAVQLAFKNLVACLTDELGQAMGYLMSVAGDDHPREIINTLSAAMNLLRKCRVNAALTIQLFSQLFHWISAKGLATVVSNANLCTRHFGVRLGNRLRNLQAWAESQGLELAAECHLAKIVQCAHLLQAPKYAPEDLANLSAVCFKLNSMQVGALLMQYKPEPTEKIAAPSMLEQASKAAESVADELARAEGREVALFEEPAPALQLLLPDDGYSCDVVQGVPPGLADFLHPLQAAGLCRLAAQPTSSGQWTVYMNAPRPPSAMSTTQPEVQVIRLHKSGGGMGLSIVAAKGAGQERLGIYIKSVVAGGAADRDGRLAAGDQLLSVDGQSLLGITQEKAAEFLQRTGSVVTLEVAKAGAVYHGLATLLQQPSPTPAHRAGPRRMSERDLPSKVDQERAIPASKSVPALHQIHAGGSGGGGDPSRPPLYQPPAPDAYGSRPVPGAAAHLAQNGGGVVAPGLRSRSTHNLHQQQQQQQDGGFYQNLSIYRNKVPSPQHLGDRTSVLRSSQNSLHSSVANSGQQRPASAYYPPAPASAAISRPPGVGNHLHQSIPNLKSPPSTHRLHGDEQVGRTGSYPNVQGYYTATSTGAPYQRHYATEDGKMPFYGNHTGQSYPSPTHNGGYGNNGLQQPLHINPSIRQEEVRYSNTGGGLLREDVFRQSERLRHEEMMSRYPSQPAIHTSRLADLPTDRLPSEIRPSKSDDALKHHAIGEISRYASSGNVAKVDGPLVTRAVQEDRHLRGAAKLAEMSEEVRRRQNRVQYNQQRDYYQQQYYNHMMSQNAQSMQNLSINPHPTFNHTPQQQYSPQQSSYSSQQNSYPPQQNSYQNPLSPTYKTPPVAPKPHHKKDDVPEPPPTSTHPLYSASLQDPPKMAFYPTAIPGTSNKPPARDPWAREEQERQQEVRREAARQWQEQQIRELAALPRRTPQQEEQLRVLQLEKEFQRRAAMEAAELDDDDTEKESPSPKMPSPSPPLPTITTQSVSSLTTTTSTSKLESSQLSPTSILKSNGNALSSTSNGLQQHQTPSYSHSQIHQQPQQQPHQPQPQQQQQQQQHSPIESQAQPPAPPERGSSFTVMSMRVKETTKRVSFNDTSANSTSPQQQQHSPQSPQQSQPPTTLQLDEIVREDPNSFIRQAESMLASPATPTDPSGSGGTSVATPGVIGAQEVYRDPRARRLAEQAQQKDKTRSEAVPEKLSFKEKMKMFAMETGEPDTPKDKSKISRAQREIDNISTPSSNLVH